MPLYTAIDPVLGRVPRCIVGVRCVGLKSPACMRLNKKVFMTAVTRAPDYSLVRCSNN